MPFDEPEVWGNCGLPSQISLGHYLFYRLRQLNVNTIFGLPGEFIMPLLDKIYSIPELRWAGNANELNAAYAADGYARIKNLACLVTTFGVGELSAINGIAGSFAEHVGVLHIVGMPPTSAQVKQLLLHHTLGNGDYSIFHRLASDVSEHTTVLTDLDICAQEIDRCIALAYKKRRPVYVGIPVNFVDALVDSAPLSIPLDLSMPPNNPELENEVVDAVLDLIYKAESPAIIADGCVSRYNISAELHELVELTQFPVFSTPMGKGAFDEQDPHFGGTFVGSMSSPEVREVVDFCDFVLVVGALLSDFNTGSFNFSYRAKNTALLFSNFVKLKNAMYPDLELSYLLRALIAKLDPTKIRYRPQPVPEVIRAKIKLMDNVPLRQEWVWSQISNWFQEGDVIITETGTSAFGINQTKFPSSTNCISQSLWGSVGYSLGACLGASFATLEEKKGCRVILFVGDGALQLTVQELSTIIRWGLTPYIFVMNNNGYTIDRLLHRKSNAGYHDIQPWHNLKLLSTFGALNYDARQIKTVGDFSALVNDENFAKNGIIRMIEIILPSMDAPPALMEKWLLDDTMDVDLSKRMLDWHDRDDGRGNKKAKSNWQSPASL
ncbi:LAMI_0B02520g1_1 [Lachancea mirantina]|uniref:LAMI_0B02520g1_1 n=1 Tax=Lachancea mirantina TaxID=1230905 RepID=A0A1G4IUP7_9SACH|nr:LAMI_0B02520g1_1 [Lachancea mirantina]